MWKQTKQRQRLPNAQNPCEARCISKVQTTQKTTHPPQVRRLRLPFPVQLKCRMSTTGARGGGLRCHLYRTSAALVAGVHYEVSGHSLVPDVLVPAAPVPRLHVKVIADTVARGLGDVDPPDRGRERTVLVTSDSRGRMQKRGQQEWKEETGGWRHRGNTLFCRAVTSILSQRLQHKMTNSRQFW